jgi:hypothetical protein
MKKRLVALFAVASIAAAMTGCGTSDAKTYDISPIFPLSSGKCAQYDGNQSGSGLGATCMVTKTECEKAAADWRSAMQSGGVNDAIQFSCSSS